MAANRTGPEAQLQDAIRHDLSQAELGRGLHGSEEPSQCRAAHAQAMLAKGHPVQCG